MKTHPDRNAYEKLQKSLELIKEANNMIEKLRVDNEEKDKKIQELTNTYESQGKLLDMVLDQRDIAEIENKKLKSHWIYKLLKW